MRTLDLYEAPESIPEFREQAFLIGAFGLLSLALDRLPSPLLSTGAILIFGIGFLAQAAVFGLPIWALASIIERRNKSPEDISK